MDCTQVFLSSLQITDLHKFEESKRWRTIGSKECSDNWIDLYKLITLVKVYCMHVVTVRLHKPTQTMVFS